MMLYVDKDLASVQEARILMEYACAARQKLDGIGQEKLDTAIACMAEAVKAHIPELAALTAEETGYGSSQDETYLLETMLTRLTEALDHRTCKGIQREDQADGSAVIGIPMGIAAVLCPAMNPALAVIYGAMICVKSGNAAVFAPAARAVKTVTRTISILAEAADRSGCPENMLTVMETSADPGIIELIGHPQVNVILNMRGTELLSACASSGRPVYAGASGPSPVFIERTADIPAAAEDILYDRSLSGGILPGAEQYVVADRETAALIRDEMKKRGAYFMTEKEEEKLITFLRPGGREHDPEYMGKTAVWLAERAGFAVPAGIRVLVSEQPYISGRNPYAAALQCPVLAFYIEEDWMHACEKCMELLASSGGGHTLVIHSADEEIIRQFACKKPVGRVLVNVPAALGAMGIATDCFPSMAPGGLTAGNGITAENITPEHLIYLRTVKRRAKSYSELSDNNDIKYIKTDYIENVANGNDEIKTIYKILKNLSQELE